MKTRTAVLYATGEPIRVEEIELDPPKEHEVLVRMVAAGICHSDHHVVTGEMPTYLPIALGHEGAGIVEAIGPEVTHCKAGDHVVLSFVPSCGKCRYCLSGHTNLCNKGSSKIVGPQLDGTFRMHSGSTNIGQFCLLSSFSEYTVIPDISVVVVDKEYPLNRAVLASCAVPTGVGAVLYRAKVAAGSTVMVIGCGGVGVNIIQGARLAGARMIIAVDIHDFKLEMAKELGATHVINAREQNPVRAAKELTDGMGVDYAFEAISTPETIGQAAAATGKNGTIVIVGLTGARVTSMPIPPMLFVLQQKTLMGTIYGDAQPQKDIPALLALYREGKLKLDELVTRTYALEQVNEAYNDTLQGRTIRGVIEF